MNTGLGLAVRKSFSKLWDWDRVVDKICGYVWDLGKCVTLCRPQMVISYDSIVYSYTDGECQLSQARVIGIRCLISGLVVNAKSKYTDRL